MECWSVAPCETHHSNTPPFQHSIFLVFAESTIQFGVGA
jgi:hypothetical protein